MNVSYIYINIAAFLCFALMFVAFCAAERSREMRAWLVLLGDLVLWTGGTVFMRLHVFPSYEFWYYVSLLALFSIAFLVYNYVYQFANVKNGLERLVWFAGTVIILIVSATGFFLAPPTVSVDGNGMAVFTYAMDWKIGIPTVFFMLIVGSIIKLFRRILDTKGKKAPGVSELIIGCFLMAIGNIVQILPGNTFPWDTLFGLAFAVLFIRSLYKRRMFNTTPVISSSILMLVSAAMCVGVAALFFEKTVELFRKSEPGEFDVILMDIMMPVMNGYEATKMIRSLDREDAKKIPIIAMTANAFTEDRIRAKEAGMDEHVAKPIDVELLIKVIHKLVK